MQAIVTIKWCKPLSQAVIASHCHKPLSQTHCCKPVMQAVLLQGADNFAREFKQLRRSFRFNEYKSISDVNPPRNFLERVSPGLVQAVHLCHSTAYHHNRVYRKKAQLRVCGVLHCTACSSTSTQT